MSTPYVYKIIHKETGKYYIGSKYGGWVTNGIVSEMIGEDYYTTASDTFIAESFTKETRDDWDVYIIYKTRGDEHDPPAEAVAHEQLFISECIDDPLCLNRHYQDIYTSNHVFTNHDYEQTAEQRAKNGNATKKRWKNPEYRKKHTEKTKGKKRTQQTKDRISKALTGKKKSPEHCKKISAHRSGYKASDETRKKMSNSSPIKGKKRTPKENAKNSAGVKRSWALRRLNYIIKNLAQYIEATK